MQVQKKKKRLLPCRHGLRYRSGGRCCGSTVGLETVGSVTGVTRGGDMDW